MLSINCTSNFPIISRLPMLPYCKHCILALYTFMRFWTFSIIYVSVFDIHIAFISASSNSATIFICIHSEMLLHVESLNAFFVFFIFCSFTSSSFLLLVRKLYLHLKRIFFLSLQNDTHRSAQTRLHWETGREFRFNMNNNHVMYASVDENVYIVQFILSIYLQCSI